MEISGKRLRGGVLGALSIGAFASAGACFSFGDLSGGDSGTEGGVAADVTSADVAAFDSSREIVDSGPTSYPSCNATLAALPGTPDGFYMLTADDGGAPFQAYCDMTHDDGGWMLVTPDMIVSDSATNITVVRSADMNGGVVVQNYPNTDSCGLDSGSGNNDLLLIAQDPPWKQIRARYGFGGGSTCWGVFGSIILPGKNLISFNPAVDTIYDQIGMGGISADGGALDTFDGTVRRCDMTNANFWFENRSAERSAVVILRRDLGGPAGLATQADCLIGFGSGTQGPTFWEYRDIYVR